MFLIVFKCPPMFNLIFYVLKVMTSNAEWGIFDADIQMQMLWPECYLLLNSHCHLLADDALKCLPRFLVFFHVLPVDFMFSQMSSMLIPISSHVVLLSSLISQVSHCFPIVLHVFSIMILVFPWFLTDPMFLSYHPQISSLIFHVFYASHVILIVLHVLLMFPPCWSWWWSWLNLSDDVLPCYHLLADDVFCLFYLFDLIIVVDCWLFLSQISCCDDIYFSRFSLYYIENMF